MGYTERETMVAGIENIVTDLGEAIIDLGGAHLLASSQIKGLIDAIGILTSVIYTLEARAAKEAKRKIALEELAELDGKHLIDEPSHTVKES